jgi:copper chaperone CopZ
MRWIAIGVALTFGTLVTALTLQDPLAAANLTPSERAAGLRSADLEVNGANCRFCRIHLERTLLAVPGVKMAAADMARHRARVVYDPSIVRPADLQEAARDGARLSPDEGRETSPAL